MSQSFRILCAEDNELLRGVLAVRFGQAGHRVEQAGNGLDAWEKVSNDISGFDLVITDHEMPGLSGLELVELLRQHNFRGRIVVYCAEPREELLNRYRELGVDAIVFKSSQTERLMHAVESCMERDGGSGVT